MSDKNQIQHQLTGLTNKHLNQDPAIGVPLHKQAVADFKRLQQKALKAGFEIKAMSGFRGFEQQLAIWNNKALGRRVLLNDQGLPLDYRALSPEQVVLSILRWSALPGMSRHHWGTDVDVYDMRGLPSPDYKVDLTPQEVAPEGIFGPFHLWLDEQIASGQSFGFYRPYAEDLNGVAPEKWHLSYAPQSTVYEAFLTKDFFDAWLYGTWHSSYPLAQLELLDVLWDLAPVVYKRFVTNVETPPFK